jgi:hypothetical protein
MIKEGFSRYLYFDISHEHKAYAPRFHPKVAKKLAALDGK